MLIRWSIWNATPAACELLRYSIASFKRAVGAKARYVVFTDFAAPLARQIRSDAEVIGYAAYPNRQFDIDSKTPWRKWCPTPRLLPGDSELFVDSDVFLLADPLEIVEFFHQTARSPGGGFLTMQESLPERWTLGRLASCVPADAPPVNAGLLGQGGDADITRALLVQFAWWRQNVAENMATQHDEQGALVAALCAERQRLSLLPESHYRIVSPRSNPHVNDPGGMVLLHATYPDHPAFERFRPAIQRYIDSVSSAGPKTRGGLPHKGEPL